MRFSSRISLSFLPWHDVNAYAGQWKLFTIFVLLWQANEWARNVHETSGTALRLLLVEAIKLVLAIAFYVWRQGLPCSRGREYVKLNGGDEGGHMLDEFGGHDDEIYPNSPLPNGHDRLPLQHARAPISTLLAVAITILASALLAYRNYNASLIERLTDIYVLYFVMSIGTLLTLIGLYAIFSRTFATLRWQAALMQFAGLFIIQATLAASPLTDYSYTTLAGLALSSASALCALNYIYTTEHSISLEALHITLFGLALIIHAAVFATQHNLDSIYRMPALELSFEDILTCPLQAALDLVLLLVIFYHDAAVVGVLWAFCAAIYLLFVTVVLSQYSLGLLAGCGIVFIGAITYTSHPQNSDEDHFCDKKTGYPLPRIIGATIVLGSLIYLGLKTPWQSTAHSRQSCQRKSLPSINFHPHERTYHAFDDVLLIVFFSHARYDVNIEYYKEVYSEFFPNIVFVGPRSREDAGFDHSYDVLVDSYESDEDLNDPTFYKMAGRMAHHMLYTAMQEYDCYDGYLWAPFDTLLNIPRLQQFNQDRFWYHSPFGQYVENLALGDLGANLDPKRHAPPANISPDPSINLTATWRGWGPDWWWGEPHVGVEVCMRAFRQVPEPMRQKLAIMTDGQTRLIGGSADTLYIPGRHRQIFMETLALFLQTDCFLEIATPTVVHLVVPSGEPILFVDHWWIWEPPLNATFVRKKWSEGFEVDTFHTFHWGDRDSDGVWRGNRAHISDVRKLLAESATRQGMKLPIAG